MEGQGHLLYLLSHQELLSIILLSCNLSADGFIVPRNRKFVGGVVGMYCSRHPCCNVIWLSIHPFLILFKMFYIAVLHYWCLVSDSVKITLSSIKETHACEVHLWSSCTNFLVCVCKFWWGAKWGHSDGLANIAGSVCSPPLGVDLKCLCTSWMLGLYPQRLLFPRLSHCHWYSLLF